MKLILCLFALMATTMSDTSLEEALKMGNYQFTANMFQEVIKEQGDKSCVLSAFSVLSPLAQLALASVGESHDELLRAVGLPNDNATKTVFTELNKRLRSVKGVDLKQANKVYVRDGFSLNDQFATLSKEVFNSDVQNINFGENVKAAKEINTWVEEHTNKCIKELISPDSISAATTAILVNAIYFKGQWKHPFEKAHTQDGDFHVNKDKKITVPMMYQTADFNYGESKEFDAKFLEMPYEGDDTSLVIILPNEIDGINTLVTKMKDQVALNKALDDMSTHEVEVSLPRFKIETTTDLKKVLQKMKIERLFKADEARLDNLLKDASNLYISDATQKAFIEVNEEGAEAAAANQFGIALLSAVVNFNQKTFTADHPFLFYLMEKNNILFNGVYRS